MIKTMKPDIASQAKVVRTIRVNVGELFRQLKSHGAAPGACRRVWIQETDDDIDMTDTLCFETEESATGDEALCLLNRARTEVGK